MTGLNISKGPEKLGHSDIAVGTVKWESHKEKQFGSFLENETCNCHGTRQLHCWEFMQENENVCPHTKTCKHMFIAGWFVTVKKWRQPRGPSMDDWLNKLIHPYHRIWLSNKKEQIIYTFNNLDASWRNYVEWKKPIPKGWLPHDSIYYILALTKL